MLDRAHILRLCDQLSLSPYQSYILLHRGHRYDLHRLVKKGGVLYAPYRHSDRNNVLNICARILLGRRADLIGTDKILIHDKRGIKIRPNGSYSTPPNRFKYHSHHLSHVR